MYIKKLFIIFVAILPLQILAQVKFGAKAGMNFTSINFMDVDPPIKSLLRLNIGTMIEIPLSESWSLYTGPYYSGKGVIHNISSQTNKIDSFTIRLNYIELPLCVGYKFPAGNENELSIATGPYLSYGFNGQTFSRLHRSTPSTHIHKKENYDYKRLDAGFNLGGLYTIKGRYGMRLDYTRGLVNIHKSNRQKNIAFSFSFFAYIQRKES